MVSLSGSLHEAASRLRNEMSARTLALESRWDPISAAWLTRGVVRGGESGDPVTRKLLALLQKEVLSIEDCHAQPTRDLAALAALYSSHGIGAEIEGQLLDRIRDILRRVNLEQRFSPLRAPEQLYLVSLTWDRVAKGQPDIEEKLLRAAAREATGPVWRKVFATASLREMGQHPIIEWAGDPITTASDVIARMWWSAKYEHGGDFSRWLSAWESVQGTISVSAEGFDPEQTDVRPLSAWELATLFEALEQEISAPDPMLLFDLFPLHPRVREIARKYFEGERYVGAVLEACAVLNERLKSKSGVLNADEVQLVDLVLMDPLSAKPPRTPRLRFNDVLDSKSGMNDQRGVSQILRGVFQAFRHPKGHLPEDDPLLRLSPYEALEQLVTISYLIRRIDAATTGPETTNDGA